MNRFSKYQVATVIAIIFHLVGLAGILFIDQTLFARATFYNLALMFLLLLYTHPKINRSFILFILICFGTGMIVEIIGTKTGFLFGNYSYGNILGPSVQNVPLIIGINWFIIIYCCGITIHRLLTKLIDRLAADTGTAKMKLKSASVIIDGATLAVVFDWIMEPVAMKLGFWSWNGNEGVPLFNYATWLVVSAILLAIFQFMKFSKQNKFAVNLLLIQFMFFLLLRTFL